jgi:phthalate 4,5-cis-dihydrodiol dehydrogenase
MSRVLRLGIAGLGIASDQVLPHIGAIADRVQLTAGADLQADAVRAFQARYPDAQGFASVEAMCRSADVDVIWVATPNDYHAEHAILAARHGKHVVCEKPMAISIEQCNDIIAAVNEHHVHYVQGHSKIYYAPLRKMREIIRSGALGRVTQISSWNYNDWLIRPVTEKEVMTSEGAGPVFRQGPHQVDIVRYLAGKRALSVRAQCGRHEAAYPQTESDYSAFVTFEDGVSANLVFQAQGYFDSAELTWSLGESGFRMLNADSVRPRERRHRAMSAAEKYEFQKKGDPYGRGQAGLEDKKAKRHQPFFGITLVSCERGLLRQSPDGVYIYDAAGRREIACEAPVKRGAAELIELWDALEENRKPFLDAHWGRATLEVCMAMLRSSDDKREVMLEHQSPFVALSDW